MNEEGASSQPVAPALRRVALLALILGGLWALGVATGVHEQVSAANIRAWIGDAGYVGIVLFVVAFAAGQVAQISGHAFIAGAVLVWGWWQGALISIVAATIGAVLSFWFARRVGGDVRHLERPLLQRVLASLDRAPLRTILVARLLFMTLPPLAPALALSGVRHRDHALGSLLGFIPSVGVTAYAWGVGLQWFGLAA